MPTDLQIAQAAELRPIGEAAARWGLDLDSLSPYGRYIAKVNPACYAARPSRARLILVSAITPTPAGEGKTTVSIALADGLNLLGKQAVLALREPSQGPVFGLKGGAAGGGYAQVLPMEAINLHFTGDLHAITAANNLLAAMVDNHIQQGNALGIDPRQVSFRRCMDTNDRQLRRILSGLGGKANGMPREDGFDITAASEVMAAFCMAGDLADLKTRLSRIEVGRTYAGAPVTCADVGAAGAMAALLRDALWPNLVQTLGGTACLMHGGPFANIAHGCNSVIATRLAMKLADYVVTEAGFGADLGAEKFIDIKCRAAGLRPDCVVLVATVRALKLHGGADRAALAYEDVPALARGFGNLYRHLDVIQGVWRLPVVVAVNRFAGDTPQELKLLGDSLSARGVPCRLCEGWAKGGEGARELAACVAEVTARVPEGELPYTYPDDMPLTDKIRAVATRVYGARDVVYTAQAARELRLLQSEGHGGLPVCVAKTQYSLSDDPALTGAPEGFDITVCAARLSAGAGFVVAFAGDIIAMPGLPRHPAALDIDVDAAGRISGLF